MDELRTLPKDFAKLVFIKVLLAIILVISLGLLLVGGITTFLYFENYPPSTIIMGGVCAWLFFLLILFILLYKTSIKVQQKKEYLLHVAQTELLATLALRSVNLLLRKWNKHHHHD